MRVNIEAQLLCLESKYLRGVPFYIINLVKALDKRNQNEYMLSFFDYGRERNNKRYIEEYLYQYLEHTELCECNSLSFKDIIDATASGDHSSYNSRTYSQYMGQKADIYHFPAPTNIPHNVDGKMVVTVNDLLPLLDEFRHYWTKEHQKAFLNTMKYIKENEEIQVIAISENTKKDLVEVLDIDKNRITVVPDAYDEKKLFCDKNRKLISGIVDGTYLLYLGAIDYRKGIIEIIEAFDMIKQHYPDLKLVLAGNIESIFRIKLEETLAKCKNQKDIIMPGFVDENQKRVLMSCAEAFLFPSEYEGFGLPILEGMACQTPVITTNVSSIPEVGGEAVLYVRKNDSCDLADKIEYLLNSESNRKKYIELGKVQLNKFSWDRTAELTEKVYAKII